MAAADAPRPYLDCESGRRTPGGRFRFRATLVTWRRRVPRHAPSPQSREERGTGAPKPNFRLGPAPPVAQSGGMSQGRPEILFPLFAEISSLPGVGPKTAKLFEKIDATRVRDLLFTPPNAVVDRRLRPTLLGVPDGAVATVEAEIGRHHPPARKGRPYRIEARDAEIEFTLVFFHAAQDWLERKLPPGTRRVLSGKIEHYDGSVQMPHPDHVLAPGEVGALPRFEPVYPLTHGLSQRLAGKAAAAAADLAPETPEWDDKAFLEARGWPDWRTAVRAIHAPDGVAALDPGAPAILRLAYDEILSHQLALALARARMRRAKGAPSTGDGHLRQAVLESLPYEPTGAQTRAAAEVAADMASDLRMLRLLQGDVGAGKTLVALLSMLVAVEAGGQAAMMAPTEILARQHAQSLAPLAAAAGVSLSLLTGRDKGKTRDDLLFRLSEGEVDIIVGTHSLFQEDVAFHDLRLAVVDEQHRFGVKQRMDLAGKGVAGADILVMTATPIPRTLALASFGDMDISVLDEKPPGRLPIDTRLVGVDRYDEVVERLRSALAEGRRAYWVCPLVEDSDVSDLIAAEERHRALAEVLGADKVGLVHGQMPPAQKDAAMAAFQTGETQLLVATTVIEVGVDVPEASIMVIERAEWFGLAQLHQLRGRVGRGADASTCLLMYQRPLGEVARARLTVMRETEDGFRIAEEDLKLRGAGDLLGVRQSGLPKFRIADLEAHGDLMKIAQDDARLVLATDPDLQSERGQALRVLLYLMEREQAIMYLRSG